MADWEDDPEGEMEQVAVIMKGEVYRAAGLKQSEYPELEGDLYDQLCNRKSLRPMNRDEVRKLAKNLALKTKVQFNPSIIWLDDFMRRFCLSRKKMGFYSKNMLKIKGKNAPSLKVKKSKNSTADETAAEPQLKTKNGVGHKKDGRKAEDQDTDDIDGKKDDKVDKKSSNSKTDTDNTDKKDDAKSTSSKKDSDKSDKNDKKADDKVDTKSSNSRKDRDKADRKDDKKADNEADAKSSINKKNADKSDKEDKNADSKFDEKSSTSKKNVDEKSSTSKKNVLDDKSGSSKKDKVNAVTKSEDNSTVEDKINGGGKDSHKLSVERKVTSNGNRIKAKKALVLPKIKPHKGSSGGKKVGSITENASEMVDMVDLDSVEPDSSKTSKNSSVSNSGIVDILDGDSGDENSLNTVSLTTSDLEDKIRASSSTSTVDKSNSLAVGNNSLPSDQDELVPVVMETDEVETKDTSSKSKVEGVSSLSLLNDVENVMEDMSMSKISNGRKDTGIILEDCAENGLTDVKPVIGAEPVIGVKNLSADSTIVLDSDEEDDIALASAAADAVLNANSEPTTVDADNALQEILKSPPRFQIKVRNLSDLMSEDVMSPPPPVPEKREAGKSFLMSLHRTKAKEEKEKAEKIASGTTSTVVDVVKSNKDLFTAAYTAEKKLPLPDSKNLTKEKNIVEEMDDKDNGEEKDETKDKKDTEDDGEEEEEEEEDETTTASSSSSDEQSKSGGETEPEAAAGDGSDSEGGGSAELKKWESDNAVTYTKKEDKLYKRSSKELLASLETSMLRCTGCNEQVNHKMDSLVFTHPILGVLLCKRCRKFYGVGKFKQDEDGLDEYCRWCANGGDLIVCDKCTNGFCKACVRRNFGRSELTVIEKSKEWACYRCDMRPLAQVRLQHRVVLQNLRDMRNKQGDCSRTEKKKTAMADKFATLKLQRKEKGIASPVKATTAPTTSTGTASPSLSPASAPWLTTCMTDLTDMLNVCLTQVGRVQSKWQSVAADTATEEAGARLQCSRRLLRLMRAMTDNFMAVETKFLEKCGDDREELMKVLDAINAEKGGGQAGALEEKHKEEGGVEKKVSFVKNDLSEEGDGREVEANDASPVADEPEAAAADHDDDDDAMDMDNDTAAPADDSHEEELPDPRKTRSRTDKTSIKGKHSKSKKRDTAKESEEEKDCGETRRRSSRRKQEEEKVEEKKSNEKVDLSKEREERMKRRQEIASESADKSDKEDAKSDGDHEEVKGATAADEAHDSEAPETEEAKEENASQSESEKEERRKSIRVTEKVEATYEESGDEDDKKSKKRKRKSTAEDGNADNDSQTRRKSKRKKNDAECGDEAEENEDREKDLKKKKENSKGANEKTSVDSDCDADTESDAEDEKKTSRSPRKTKKKRDLKRGEDVGSEEEAEDGPRLSPRKRLPKAAYDSDEGCSSKKRSHRKKGKKNKNDEDIDSDEFEKRKEAYKKKEKAKLKSTKQDDDESDVDTPACGVENDADEEVASDAGKEVASDGGKEVDPEAGKEVDPEAGEEVASEAGKEVASEAGKEVASDADEENKNSEKNESKKSKSLDSDEDLFASSGCEDAADVEAAAEEEATEADGANSKEVSIEKDSSLTEVCSSVDGSDGAVDGDGDTKRDEQVTSSKKSRPGPRSRTRGKNKEVSNDDDAGEGRTTPEKTHKLKRSDGKDEGSSAKKNVTFSNLKDGDSESEDGVKKEGSKKGEKEMKTSEKESKKSVKKEESKEGVKKEKNSKSANDAAKSELLDSDSDSGSPKKSSDNAKKSKSSKSANEIAMSDLLASDSDDTEVKSRKSKQSKTTAGSASDSDSSIMDKSFNRKSTRSNKSSSKDGKNPKEKSRKKKEENNETKNDSADNSSDDTDDCLGLGRDEDECEGGSSSKRVKRRPKASPRRVQERRQQQQLEKLEAVVPITRMSNTLVNRLQQMSGSLPLSECKKLLRKSRKTSKKNPKKDSKSDEEKGQEEDQDSDAEFTSLMKFKLKKKQSSKNSCSDEDEESEGGEEKEEETGTKTGKEGEKKERKKGERKSKEGLLDISLQGNEEGEEEEDAEDVGLKKKEEKKVDPSMAFNEKMKKTLLLSSDEERGGSGGDDTDDSATRRERCLLEEEKKKKYDKMKQQKKEKEGEEVDGEEDKEKGEKKDGSEEEEEEKVKPVGKKGYLSLKFSSDEEDGGEGKSSKSKDDKEEEEDEEDEEDSDDSEYESPRKSRMFIDSDSDFELDSRKSRRKSKKKSSSGSESADDSDQKSKKSRKRIRKQSSTSSEEDSTEKAVVDPNEDTPSKKKHRRIIRDEDLTESTKNATQQEEDRRNRIKERQQIYNKIFEIDVETDQSDLKSLVLDFDPKTKKELVSVHPKLVPMLKPHQIEGIKFMWDATCESVERVSKEEGSGAILAHCMGLGKTMQVIVFVHTLLTSKRLESKMNRVLVLCPVNTVYNWVAEFKKWLKGKLQSFDVVELISAKDLWTRAYRLDEWHAERGVCIMGYDMFRTLSNEKNKKYKGKMKEIFQKTLVNPGPDFVVCDEGHILKNEKTAMSIAVNKLTTMRRVVLTGTPLQNNLKEYHCMIQFVKPNLLGTRKEFLNRFVNPITAGSCADATPRDVKRMKRRAHILHNLLEGCVQRFDYTVLKPFLPPKMEYVISVQMSELQIALYSYYLEHLAQGGPKRVGSGLFVDFNCLGRVWTHPKVLDLQNRRACINESDDEEMDDFICDETTSESSDDDRPKKKRKKTGKESEEDKSEESKPASPDPDEGPEGLYSNGKVRPDWWKKIVSKSVSSDIDEDEWMNRIELSGKLTLLLDILRECCGIGDKVLLFSQSILCLDMVEEFLYLIDKGKLKMPSHEDSMPMQYKYWKKERDYLRLDGTVSADIRKSQCQHFNDPKNDRCRLFLISTRAGGIGINLVSANRVIIFDSSWNPAHDTQSIFRVYRFGQKKPCYIYRFVAQGTMEEKIYSRQVAKLSTSLRVVDEHQIKRYFNTTELADLYEFNPADADVRETPIVPDDRLLADLIIRHKKWIVGYHEHDSLLENQTHEGLSEEERKAAWEDFENEKKGLVPQFTGRAQMNTGNFNSNMPFPSSIPAFDINQVVQSIYSQNQNLTPAQLHENVVMATRQIQKIHLNHYQRVQSYVYNLKNPMIAPEIRAQLPYGNQADVLPLLEGQLSVLEDNIRRENQVITQMQPDSSKPSTSSLMAAGLAYGSPTTATKGVGGAVMGGGSRTQQYVDRSKAVVNRARPIPAALLPGAPKHPPPSGTNPPKRKDKSGAEIVTLE